MDSLINASTHINRRKFFEEQRKKPIGSGIIDPASLFKPSSHFLGKGLEFLDDLTKGHFKYYGNYAGPSYSAGKRFEKNQIITKSDLQVKPKDHFDALTQQHDLRYQLAATHESADARKRGLRYADEIFIRDAEKLLNSRDLDATQYAAAWAAIQAFKLKLKTDMGYNVDQIPGHDIDEAKAVVHDFFNTTDISELKFKPQTQDAPRLFSDADWEELELNEKADQLKQEVEDQTEGQETELQEEPETTTFAFSDEDQQLAWAAMQLIF
jgi:hypothetical protein